MKFSSVMQFYFLPDVHYDFLKIFQVAKVTKDAGYHMLTKEEVEDLLKDLSI